MQSKRKEDFFLKRERERARQRERERRGVIERGGGRERQRGDRERERGTIAEMFSVKIWKFIVSITYC